MPHSPLLIVDDLRVSFRTPNGMVRAVDGVSLRLDRGSSLGIVGESGSGKSVLARSIMRLPAVDRADVAGRVEFEGEDLSRQSARGLRRLWGARMSMVFQDPLAALTPTRRIGAQLMETLHAHQPLSRAAARERALELLSEVGLPDVRRHFAAYPHQLSGGMRQRVCIAIAVSCLPALLIADEPTTALDVTIQGQILDLLGDLQRENDLALALITHDLGVVAGRTERVMVMYAGQVVESGPTRRVFDRPRHPYTAALLASTPTVDDPPHRKLPVLFVRNDQDGAAGGCRFAPRCARVTARCWQAEPSLQPAAGNGQDRLFACFNPVGDDEVRVAR